MNNHLTKNGKRLQIALKALRTIANLPGNGAMAKVARIALSDCRDIKAAKCPTCRGTKGFYEAIIDPLKPIQMGQPIHGKFKTCPDCNGKGYKV